MNDSLQVSVLVYTLEYPERTVRCMDSLSRQTGVQLDIRFLADQEFLKDMRKQFPQIGKKCIYTGQRKNMSGCVTKALQDCMYENVMFVSSDAVFEGDALEKILRTLGSADGLVFNYSIVRPSLKYSMIYPIGLACRDLFRQKSIELPDQESTFTAENIYESCPNIWNHVYKKSLLLQHKIRLDDFTRISQYLFIAEYHSYCRTLALDTSLFVYKEHQGEKIIPDIGFCIRHYTETIGLVRRAYKRFTPDTVRLLSNDFRVSPGQVTVAVKRKLAEKKGQV